MPAGPARPARPAREEGTDGLLGGIPFGLPNDTPYPTTERVNRFTIDDHVVGWSTGPSSAPTVRRLGGLTNYEVDPSER